jgi:type III secretory pathway component EscS
MVKYTQNTQVCDESLSFTCWLLVISSTNENDHHDLTEMLLKVTKIKRW